MGIIPALLTTTQASIFVVTTQTANYGDFNNIPGNSLTGG